MSEENQPEQGEAVAEPQQVPMNKESAIKQVLAKALTRGCVVKGISEVCKALEAKKVKWVFLAENCDNDDYKNLVRALSKQNGVPVIDVEEWIFLKDSCNIGLNSEKIKQVAESKGKEAKIKPKCASCAIIDFGEETEGFTWLKDNLHI